MLRIRRPVKSHLPAVDRRRSLQRLRQWRFSFRNICGGLDIVFAAALPDPEIAGPMDPFITGIEPQHGFAQCDQIMATGLSRFDEDIFSLGQYADGIQGGSRPESDFNAREPASD